MSGAFPDLRPGPKSSLASTAAPLLSNSSAAATKPLRATKCSGVRPQAAFPRKAVGAAVGFRRRRRGAEADAPWEDDGSGG